MKDTNDINESTYGLPLNNMIIKGEIKMAKELIEKYNANIFIQSKTSLSIPLQILFSDCSCLWGTFNAQLISDLLNCMLIRYYARYGDETINIIYPDVRCSAGRIQTCEERLIILSLPMPRDIINIILKYIPY